MTGREQTPHFQCPKWEGMMLPAMFRGIGNRQISLPVIASRHMRIPPPLGSMAGWSSSISLMPMKICPPSIRGTVY